MIEQFIAEYPEIRLFKLPTYSPEYNPTEQVWKWLKPMVHAAKTMTGGIEELLHRLRKIMHARVHHRLLNPPTIGLGIWKSIF